MLIGPVQTALLISIAVLVVVLGGVLTLLLRRELIALRGESSEGLSARTQEIDGRLQAIVETMDRRLGELDVKVDRRMENASKQTVEIHERLGKLNEATTQMNDRVKDLARLEQALKPPKARGGFGELLLENLLRDSLPPPRISSCSTDSRVVSVSTPSSASSASSRSTPSSRSTTSSASSRPRARAIAWFTRRPSAAI